MKFEYYSPTFRNILLQEVISEKTEGGIYKPSTDFLTTTNEKEFEVIKIAKECTDVQIGDKIKLERGAFLDEFDLFVDKKRTKFFQVKEHQVAGIERILKPSAVSMEEFTVQDTEPEPEFEAEVVGGFKG